MPSFVNLSSFTIKERLAVRRLWTRAQQPYCSAMRRSAARVVMAASALGGASLVEAVYGCVKSVQLSTNKELYGVVMVMQKHP